MQAIVRFVINVGAGSGELEVVVEDIVVSTFTYEDNTISMTYLPAITDQPLTEFRKNIALTRGWIQQINQYLMPNVNEPLADFESDILKKNKKIRAKYTSGDLLTRHVYNNADKMINIDERPACSISYGQFIQWIDFLDAFAQYALKF